MARTREQRISAGLGIRRRLDSPLYTFDGYLDNLASQSRITDLVSKGDGQDLTIDKITVTGNLINGDQGGSITGRRYENVQPQFIRNGLGSSIFSHATVSGRPTNAMLAAELLAKTNPSRPVVDLPLAIYELREIPELLRKEGGNLIQKMASLNLKYQFGIKPLVNDLMSLLSFSDEVAKRQKELDELYKSGLRRKRKLWNGSAITSTDITTNSIDRHIIHTISQVSTMTNIWGFTTWTPNSIQMMKADRRALARKAVLGLTVDFSLAWNAIPWSWLIDWCSNVGDVLIANRNLVGAVHGPVQIMETIKTTADTTSPQAECSPGAWTKVTKTRRTVVNVPISAQLPILNLRQLSILGSIGVTRRMPKS